MKNETVPNQKSIPDGDRFFFEAFREEKPAEETEAVALPNQRTTKAEYLARVLCNNMYLASSTKFQESAKRFLEISRKAGEWNTAMVKMLRAMFSLDGDHEPAYLKEDTADDELQVEVNKTLLDAAMHNIVNDRFYTSGGTFYEQLVNAARHVNHKFGLIASRFRIKEQFAEKAYGKLDYYGETLEDALREHDQTRLRLPDVKIQDGIMDIAEALLSVYPVLHNRVIREQLVDAKELCYTICAAFAPEVITSKEYRDASVTIIRSEAPAKIKFVTAMMAIDHDNFLRIVDMIRHTDLGGYHEPNFKA